MRASQLIKELQESITKFGDIEVVFEEHAFNGEIYYVIEEIKKDNELWLNEPTEELQEDKEKGCNLAITLGGYEVGECG